MTAVITKDQRSSLKKCPQYNQQISSSPIINLSSSYKAQSFHMEYDRFQHLW